MSQTLRKLVAFIILCLMTESAVYAQKTMDVSKFSKMENDLMARVTKPVRDKDEGKLCAMIRVVTNLTDLEFRADALGIVQKEEHGGETWLYVPYGAKSISFSRQGYFPLMYQYALPIEEGTVYELRLSSYEAVGEGTTQQLNTQMFVLTHHPDNATVYVDNMEVPSEYGVFAAIRLWQNNTKRPRVVLCSTNSLSEKQLLCSRYSVTSSFLRCQRTTSMCLSTDRKLESHLIKANV